MTLVITDGEFWGWRSLNWLYNSLFFIVFSSIQLCEGAYKGA